MARFMQNLTLKNPVALLQLRERCGLAHDRQILRIPWPAALDHAEVVRVHEGSSEAIRILQRSATDPRSGFVELLVSPFQPLVITPGLPGDCAEETAAPWVTVENPDSQTGVISNGVFSLEVFLGEASCSGSGGFEIQGPVSRIRVGSGPWRGRTFLDSRRPAQTLRGELLENGPLRVVYRFSAGFAPEGFYQATITMDRGQPFAVVEEEFQAGSADQVLWDFSNADLPEKFYLLDSSASYQTCPLFYHLDQRLTRMISWTQQSQHFNFSDGYAIGFAASADAENARDIAGFVALEGGTWRGGKLNHLEAWTRRWFPGDPASRRGVAFEAKADSHPGPERIAARGVGICEPHFNVEGWIGNGRRKWALVLTTLDKIEPVNRSGEPLGPFENQPDRKRYRDQQSLLRKIHTQRGILPLQEMVGMEFVWDEEPKRESGFAYPNEVLRRHETGAQNTGGEGRELMEFLAARVYGFWEGSGSAYSNPVVSRPVVPGMFRYEWLARQGILSGEERALARAHFAFLMHLFASENYYAGDAAMQPVGSPDSLDPTIAGMANQNFYTDVINVFGAGAQIFWKHPRAGDWRKLFIERWHRQLEFHIYPESGLWEESHTYYHHVLHTVLPTFLRRRADDVDDEFANPAFQKLAGAEISQLTPRDAFFGDCRHVVIFGDHGVEIQRYRYLWRELAEAFAPHNRALAESLAWAYHEMGGQKPITVSAQAPRLGNEYVQGLGVMFRGVDAAGRESLLALRSGNAWGHHHSDDGSIQFYAKGRAMIVDAGFAGRSIGRKKLDASGHSRWMPKHLEPVNFLWRFNRGWITASDLEGPLAFATAYSPVFMVRAGPYPAVPLRRPIEHFRTIIQITPAVYLVVDLSDSDQDQVVLFHVPGAENVVPEGSGAKVAFRDNCQLNLQCVNSPTPPLLVVDHPKDPEEACFVTTALEYDIQRDSFSAFLIVADSEDGRSPEIARTAVTWAMRGRDFNVTLHRETARRLILTDHLSKITRTIDPWPHR